MEESSDPRVSLTRLFFGTTHQNPNSPEGPKEKHADVRPHEDVIEEQKKLISGDTRALVLAHLMSEIIDRSFFQSQS